MQSSDFKTAQTSIKFGISVQTGDTFSAFNLDLGFQLYPGWNLQRFEEWHAAESPCCKWLILYLVERRGRRPRSDTTILEAEWIQYDENDHQVN